MLTKLDLGHNQLSTLPPELPTSLQTLSCLDNAFETVPPAVAALTQLRMLSFESCRLRDLGAAPLPASVVWLILTSNKLTSLPESIGQLTGMRKLMLANNHLAALPDAMGAMKELELLRISNNEFGSFPPWLYYSLPKLSWLAIAANPAVLPAPSRAALDAVSYDELSFGPELSSELGPELGEGSSSSVVRRGGWHGQAVAIKVYKAPLSSDGRSVDEVRASCAVDHPNVLRWLTYLEEGGAAQEASATAPASGTWRLVGVLEWAPGFRSLGKPPSMATITRDTYPPQTHLTAAEVRTIAHDIASALEHLHSRGVAHGDLYAHNILWRRQADETVQPSHRHHHPRDTEGEVAVLPGLATATLSVKLSVKLSGFGAAFYYGPAHTHSDPIAAERAAAYERMEQRAFGLLLEELLEHHEGDSEAESLYAVREAAALATAAPDQRPGFGALVQLLHRRGRYRPHRLHRFQSGE